MTHSFSKYFIEKTSEECKKNGLLDVDTLIVGVSGGPDSMALLSFLSKVYPLERIFVVHVNHNIRPIDCDRDEKLVVDFCKSINCLLYTSPSPRDRTRSRMPSSA